jgi:hypothetical protein
VETLSDWLRRDIGLSADVLAAHMKRIDEIRRMHGGWP